MKLISLNTWGGRAGHAELLRFLESHADADFFCLQEVWHGGEHMVGKKAGGAHMDDVLPQLFKSIDGVLVDHDGHFRPHFYDFYGLAMFTRKNLTLKEEGELFIYKDRGYISDDDLGNHARNLQYVTIETPRGPRTVIHFHGLWNGGGKFDSEDRLKQSDNVIAFIQRLQNPFVIVGDFNLLPGTESMKKFEEFGLRNLIKEHGITSTRTSHYKKEHRFADYALVSDGIEVKEFKVLPDEVSDHSPLYLDFT